MDAAALQAVVAEAVKQALVATAAARANADGEKKGGSTIHKYFTRLEKFDGEQWKEWYYQFGVAANTYNVKNGALLEIVENLELDEVSTVNIELELSQGESNWMAATQSEMFGVLSLLTKGEANLLVRSCEDKNGYTAWKKLYDRFNPKTPASLTAAWREVIRPKKIKDMREAGKSIDEWEGKVAILKKEHSEEPTTGLKASLLLEMLPDNVQLTVAQGMSSKKLEYDTLKAKIKLMANVQIDYSTPKPMDIGELEQSKGDEYVDAVGAQKGKGKGPSFGSCWTCGGNHYARECPTNGGKGQKGKGKGDEKGKGKGKSTGPMFGSCWTCGGNHFSRDCPRNTAGGDAKGGGKGLGKNIKCFNCGGVGHRAAQCPTSVREVDQEYEEEEGEVASVSEDWGINGVDECRRPRCQHRGEQKLKPGGEQKLKPEPLALSNRFGALAEQEGDEAADEILETAEERGWRPAGKGEIVVDSGAAESVCPWGWAAEFPVKEVPWEQRRRFVNASGGRMGHYGEKKVHCKFEGQTMPASMRFQVSDCRNPLASVARTVENGNIVQFGPKEEDNFILNPGNGEKVRMKRKGRKFVLDVELVRKGLSFSGQA